MNEVVIRPFAALSVAELYAVLRLRSEVFVVEQECAYLDPDGRDAEPGTRHVWTADDAGPSAYLRMLDEPDGTVRIGRVCTRVDARGAGSAALLMGAALRESAGRPVVLGAQSHLAGWYGRFGFVVDGPEYVEDGIPHVPMRRPADG